MRAAKRTAHRQVMLTWMSTIFTLATMFGMLFFLSAITAFFGEWRKVVLFLETGSAALCAMYLLQEPIVTIRLRGKVALREDYPRFHEAVDFLMQGRRFMARPQLWIVRMPKPVPNAVAFGPGLFGWHSIAITDSLYHLLDDEELKAVVGHEFAHLRCKDTGLLTLLSLVQHGAGNLSSALRKTGILGWAPIGWAISFLVKCLFPIGTAALSQQREYAADALSAVYTGSPQPLMRALQKLSEEFSKVQDELADSRGILSDLYLSHPKMEDRIKALEGYGEEASQEPLSGRRN